MPRSDAKSANPSHRIERVAESIRHALAEILSRGDVADPLLDRQVVTIPTVRMSPDLKLAPDLRFTLDDTFDAQSRIDALLRTPEVARDLRNDETEDSN